MRGRVLCPACAAEVAEVRRQAEARRRRDQADKRALARAAATAQAQAIAAEAEARRWRALATQPTAQRPTLKLRLTEGGDA